MLEDVPVIFRTMTKFLLLKEWRSWRDQCRWLDDPQQDERSQRGRPNAAIIEAISWRLAASWNRNRLSTRALHFLSLTGSKKIEKAAVSSLFYLGFAYFLPINTASLQLPVAQVQFISVIFFFPRNLGGNLITQIRDGTFQAWHGMQFLQKL